MYIRIKKLYVNVYLHPDEQIKMETKCFKLHNTMKLQKFMPCKKQNFCLLQKYCKTLCKHYQKIVEMILVYRLEHQIASEHHQYIIPTGLTL